MNLDDAPCALVSCGSVSTTNPARFTAGSRSATRSPVSDDAPFRSAVLSTRTLCTTYASPSESPMGDSRISSSSASDSRIDAGTASRTMRYLRSSALASHGRGMVVRAASVASEILVRAACAPGDASSAATASAAKICPSSRVSAVSVTSASADATTWSYSRAIIRHSTRYSVAESVDGIKNRRDGCTLYRYVLESPTPAAHSDDDRLCSRPVRNNPEPGFFIGLVSAGRTTMYSSKSSTNRSDAGSLPVSPVTHSDDTTDPSETRRNPEISLHTRSPFPDTVNERPRRASSTLPTVVGSPGTDQTRM